MTDREEILNRLIEGTPDLQAMINASHEADAESMIQKLGIEDPAEQARIRRSLLHDPPREYSLLSLERVLEGP